MPKVKAKNKAKSKKGKEKAGAPTGARLGLGNELLRLGGLCAARQLCLSPPLVSSKLRQSWDALLAATCISEAWPLLAM